MDITDTTLEAPDIELQTVIATALRSCGDPNPSKTAETVAQALAGAMLDPVYRRGQAHEARDLALEIADRACPISSSRSSAITSMKRHALPE
jgi:hypothetical protein